MMPMGSGGKGQVSNDLRGFLIAYENAVAAMHPSQVPAHEKKLVEMHEYVEWTGDAIRFEDVSELGNRPERYYIRVLDRANPKTPGGNPAGFTAYFVDIDASGQAKIHLDQRITIHGTLWRRDRFSKTWFLKDCTIV